MAEDFFWTKRSGREDGPRSEAPIVTAFMSELVTTATSQVLRETFRLLDNFAMKGVGVWVEPRDEMNEVVPGLERFDGVERDANKFEPFELTEIEKTVIAHKTQEAIEGGLQVARESSLAIFAGGRDVEPTFRRQGRTDLVQPCHTLDVRDAVEAFQCLQTVAKGGTIHATCRGMQLTTYYASKVLGGEGADLAQHLPIDLSVMSHSPDDGVQHHGGGELHTSLSDVVDELQKNNDLVRFMTNGEVSPFNKLKGGTHPVLLKEDSLMKDAFEISQARFGEERVQIERREDGDFRVNPATLHHQGYIAHPWNVERIENAGGKIVGISDDPRDQGVGVIEAVSFSALITPEIHERIQGEVDHLNGLLGTSIQIEYPDLSDGVPRRIDVPHCSQCHPEINIAGVAPAVPFLTAAYTSAKEVAKAEGRDIGGYDEWMKGKDKDELIKEFIEFSTRQVGS
jgi:hypothetical protein